MKNDLTWNKIGKSIFPENRCNFREIPASLG